LASRLPSRFHRKGRNGRKGKTKIRKRQEGSSFSSSGGFVFSFAPVASFAVETGFCLALEVIFRCP
jgi:hypothetical protein